FMVVEDMPLFPGCDTEKTKEDKKKCSDRKVFEFVFKNLKYPVIARENGIEGTAVIQFVVDKDGAVKDVSVLKDIGGGCGEEASRVVNTMNESGIKWTPGRQRGRPVKVQFRLPVRFKLQ
ncbi:MAG: outer membrane protein TonB, partial [Bacteroidota bacterium]